MSNILWRLSIPLRETIMSHAPIASVLTLYLKFVPATLHCRAAPPSLCLQPRCGHLAYDLSAFAGQRNADCSRTIRGSWFATGVESEDTQATAKT